MALARKLLAICLASLVVWFGVAAAAPVHAHPVDASQPLFLQLIADDAHDDHVSHDHKPAADTGSPDNNLPDPEQALHAHGCTHVATMSEPLNVSQAAIAAPTVWFETSALFHSLGQTPPRKPPRLIL